MSGANYLSQTQASTMRTLCNNSKAVEDNYRTMINNTYTVRTDPNMTGKMSRKMLREREIVEKITKEDLKEKNTKRHSKANWDKEIAVRTENEITEDVLVACGVRQFKNLTKPATCSESRKKQLVNQFASKVGLDVRSAVIETSEMRNEIPFVQTKNSELEKEIDSLLKKTSRILGYEIFPDSIPDKRQETNIVLDTTNSKQKTSSLITMNRPKKPEDKFEIGVLEELLKESLETCKKYDSNKKSKTVQKNNAEEFASINAISMKGKNKIQDFITSKVAVAPTVEPIIPPSTKKDAADYEEALKILKSLYKEKEDTTKKLITEREKFIKLQNKKSNAHNLLATANIVSRGAMADLNEKNEVNEPDENELTVEKVKTTNGEYGVFKRKIPVDGYYARMMMKKGLIEDFEARTMRAPLNTRRMKSYYNVSSESNNTIPIECGNGVTVNLDLNELSSAMRVDERTRIYDKYNLLNTNPNRMDPEMVEAFINPRLRVAERNILKAMQGANRPRSSAFF